MFAFVHDAETGEPLYAASVAARVESIVAARSDGGAGVIERRGRRVYVPETEEDDAFLRTSAARRVLRQLGA